MNVHPTDTIIDLAREMRGRRFRTILAAPPWRFKNSGLHGIYHHASEKHLHRYVNEITFRLNDGDVKRHTLERLASLVSAPFGQRISHKDLTA